MGNICSSGQNSARGDIPRPGSRCGALCAVTPAALPSPLPPLPPDAAVPPDPLRTSPSSGSRSDRHRPAWPCGVEKRIISGACTGEGRATHLCIPILRVPESRPASSWGVLSCFGLGRLQLLSAVGFLSARHPREGKVPSRSHWTISSGEHPRGAARDEFLQGLSAADEDTCSASPELMFSMDLDTEWEKGHLLKGSCLEELDRAGKRGTAAPAGR
ncbi:uncharacterized protein LOC122168296 [Centrocercus urophasianus]|uniref:uncharacterized protein LOC122168296 n=1 Tax=Centrocercus urophasianus TaxID=9002 RepID=UPI001C64FA3A|nr:uncharacterized protein LOC122168296 [Centrocercus urophasianus]